MRIVAILVWILLFGFVSVGLRLFILCGYGCCVLLRLRFDCLGAIWCCWAGWFVAMLRLVVVVS